MATVIADAIVIIRVHHGAVALTGWGFFMLILLATLVGPTGRR